MPGICWVGFGGCGWVESSEWLHVFTERDRAIIDVPEGTQRSAAQQRIKLPPVSTVFLTSLHPDVVGGLPGLILTMAEFRKESIQIVGPVGLQRWWNSVLTFAQRPAYTVNIEEIKPDTPPRQFKIGGEVVITPIVLSSSSSSSSSSSAAAETSPSRTREFNSGSDDEQSKRRRIDAAGLPPGAVKVETEAEGATFSIVYKIEFPQLPNKFDKTKAEALGIKKGPLYGALSRGETVTLEDGRIISPDQVVEKGAVGPLALAVRLYGTCQKKTDIENGEEEKTRGGGVEDSIRALIHAVPPIEEERKICVFHMGGGEGRGGWARNEGYLQWAAGVGNGKPVSHVFANTEVAGQTAASMRPYEQMKRYNLIDPDLFPLPNFSATAPSFQPPEYLVEKGHESFSAVATPIRFVLSPAHLAGTTVVPFAVYSTSATLLEAIEKHGEIQALKEQVREEKKKIRSSDEGGEGDWHIDFLGTGAACPSVYRNVSSVVARPSNARHGTMVFDCGEGTVGQIERKFGTERLKEVLDNIRLVWISHMHADHHLGLVRLLAERSKNTAAPPLVVVGPTDLLPWLRESGRWSKLSFTFITCQQLSENPSSFAEWGETVGIRLLQNVPVVHCCDSWGCRVDHMAGWSFLYSGDTRPCEALVELGKDITVAVHEATFETGMEGEAIRKKHSTTGEALDVCSKMNASFAILTHFSQRYPKIPAAVAEHSVPFGIAFDHMTVNGRLMSVLPFVMRAVMLACDLEEEIPEDEDENNGGGAGGASS